jgi:dipeptide/tripeptide permease
MPHSLCSSGGGFIAIKYLGFRKAIVFGGIMLVLGHLEWLMVMQQLNLYWRNYSKR